MYLSGAVKCWKILMQAFISFCRGRTNFTWSSKKSTESISHYHNTKDPIQTPKWREKSRKKQHLMPEQFGNNKIMPYLRTHLLKKRAWMWCDLSATSHRLKDPCWSSKCLLTLARLFLVVLYRSPKGSSDWGKCFRYCLWHQYIL